MLLTDFWGSTNKLVGMLNKDYSPGLGALSKGDIDSAVSTFFNCKQHFDQLNQSKRVGIFLTSGLCQSRKQTPSGQQTTSEDFLNQVWFKNRGSKREGSRSW